MKKWYVYELYNILGTIEYVGETVDIKRRFNTHKSKKGKFYGRTDISINIVKEFDNKKDAFKYQCKLQKQYGLVTDAEKYSENNRNRIHSVETKLKISLAMKSKPIGNKLGIKNNKPFSEKARQSMREAAIRRWNTDND